MDTAARPQIASSLHLRVWRWHFFAGLLVVPFAIILALTGSIYLFKPQIEAAIDRQIFAKVSATDPATYRSADRLLERALATHPNSQLVRYIVPKAEAPAARMVIKTPAGQRMLWVRCTDGAIVHDVAMSHRFMETVRRIHSSLLIGWVGNRLVELAACLMILLIASGAYLYWPRGQSWRSALLPDISLRGRALWRSLHGAIGLWSGGLILALLLSGLPWTGVWGEGFTNLRNKMGWTGPGQEWFVTLQSQPAPQAPKGDGLKLWATHADEGVVTLSSSAPPAHIQTTPKSLQWAANRIAGEALPHPIWIQPPRGENGVWTVRAMPITRHERRTLHFDRWSGEEIMQIRFADYHPVEKAMGHGLSFHEGGLFGPLNQALGVFAAFSVMGLSVAGTLSWWRRRRPGRLGAPPLPALSRPLSRGLKVGLTIALVLLPVAGLAVAFVWLGEKLVTRLPLRSFKGS